MILLYVDTFISTLFYFNIVISLNVFLLNYFIQLRLFLTYNICEDKYKIYTYYKFILYNLQYFCNVKFSHYLFYYISYKKQFLLNELNLYCY